MKRATVLLSLISLVVIFLSPVYGQNVTTVEKPDLPQGYESWQYKLSHSCQNLTETVWGRVDKEKKAIEYLVLREMNGKTISYIHAGVDLTQARFSNTYAQKDNKWFKFNSMKDGEDEIFKKLQRDEFAKNGLDKKTFAASCEKFFDEFFDFQDKLFEKASK